MTALYKQFKDGWKRLKSGRDTCAPAMNYKEIVDSKNLLFDIYPDDMKRRQQCEQEWGVKMSPAEKVYYEDQQIERK